MFSNTWKTEGGHNKTPAGRKEQARRKRTHPNSRMQAGGNKLRSSLYLLQCQGEATFSRGERFLGFEALPTHMPPDLVFPGIVQHETARHHLRRGTTTPVAPPASGTGPERPPLTAASPTQRSPPREAIGENSQQIRPRGSPNAARTLTPCRPARGWGSISPLSSPVTRTCPKARALPDT